MQVKNGNGLSKDLLEGENSLQNGRGLDSKDAIMTSGRVEQLLSTAGVEQVVADGQSENLLKPYQGFSTLVSGGDT